MTDASEDLKIFSGTGLLLGLDDFADEPSDLLANEPFNGDVGDDLPGGWRRDSLTTAELVGGRDGTLRPQTSPADGMLAP